MGLLDSFNSMASANIQGQQILADLDEKKVQTAQRQAATAGQLLENQSAQINMDNRKALSEWMRADAAKAAGPSEAATDLASQFARATKFAADSGDLENAKVLGKLTTEQIEDAGRKQTQLEKQQADDSDALSVAAQNVLADPSQANHITLFQKALKAGVNPLDIPVPGTPQYDAFLNQSALAAMKGQKRLEFQETIRNREAMATAKREEQEARRADRAADRANLAAYREQGLDIRREANRIRESLGEQRLAKADGSTKLSATMERQAVAVTNAANEAGQALDRLSKMDFGDTASAFSHLEDPKTVLKALTTTGTNKVTPEKIQMLQANSQLLGLEVAQAMAAPYKPNKEQISEARKMTEVSQGDTEYTAMYKMALAAAVMRTRLESIPKTDALKDAREHAEANFARFPSPDEVYQHARARGIKLKLRKDSESFMDRLKQIGTPNEGAAPAPATAAAGPSPEIQALLDHYAPKK